MIPGTIVLDKERHLRMTRYGMERYNEATVKDFANFEKDEKTDKNLFYAAIWSYLVWEDESITIDQVKGWVSKLHTPTLIKALEESNSQTNVPLENPAG